MIDWMHNFNRSGRRTCRSTMANLPRAAKIAEVIYALLTITDDGR
jgi:hypothetical protein